MKWQSMARVIAHQEVVRLILAAVPNETSDPVKIEMLFIAHRLEQSWQEAQEAAEAEIAAAHAEGKDQ